MTPDGSCQTAIANNQQIYVSSDYGVTWQTKDTSRTWHGVAMSS
jgi:hypothetical protein